MNKTIFKLNGIAKWVKIIRDRYAVVGSDGQINPSEENISDDHIYVIVNGGPLKIARAAAQFRKTCR